MQRYYNIIQGIAVIIVCFAITGCTEQTQSTLLEKPVYVDAPYLQDYSIKYNIADSNIALYSVYEDRNNVIKVLTSKGLMQPDNGEMLYPGTLSPDSSYRAISAKKIQGLGLYQKQFVYIDDKAVLSNAWAGKLYTRHALPAARIFCGDGNFAFLVSDGRQLQWITDSTVKWQTNAEDTVLDMQYSKVQTSSLLVPEA